MKYFIMTLFIALFSYGNSQNCTYTFIGDLTDFHDGTPLMSATIYIKERNAYKTSDENGKFKIENLCKGPLTLTISHIACETKTVSYSIDSDTYKSIVLEHHIEELNEVSISSTITRKETETAQETVLKTNVLKKYSSQNLGDALKEVPGVSSISTGNAIVKPMINGLHSSRLLILNNGVRQQDQEWGIEHAPNIDINSADQISVIKGSGALAYGGDAIGGVVVINPKRVILKDSIYGKTILSGQTNGRGYSLTSSLYKNYRSGWFITGQASIKQNGDFESPNYVLSNTGLNTKGLTLRGGKKNFENGFELYYSFYDNVIGILRASHIGNVEDLVNSINSQEPLVINDFTYDINSPKQEVQHHLLKASYYRRFKNFGKVSLQYDYQNNQRFEFDVRRSEDDRDRAALDLKLQTHTLSTDVVLDSKSNQKIKFGLLVRYQNNFANPATGVRRLIPDYDKYDFGVYAINEWRLSDDLLMDAGLRYDFNRIDAKKFYRTSRWEERGYDEDFGDIVIEDLGTQLLTNPVLDFHNFSASAGLKYFINSKSHILGNYSLSSRPPNPSELFSDGLHHSAARIELGELRLNKEISNRISASYNYKGSDFNFLVEGFYNRINDYMFIEPSGVEQTIRGAFPVWSYVQRDSELYGIDLSANFSISENFNLSNKSSYTLANEIDTNRPLIDIPAFNTENTITYNNNWNDFSISLINEWVFEQTRFPDNNFVVTLPETEDDVLVDISTPPSGYNLLHLYSDVTFKTSNKTSLNVSLSVNNILNTEYRAYLNRLRYFADDLGRNIMLQIQFNY